MIACGHEPEDACNLDLLLTLEDGSRWSATVLSAAEIARILEHWRETGESLGGKYLTCPDLLVIRDPGVSNICAVLEDILAIGGPAGYLQPVEEDELSGD